MATFKDGDNGNVGNLKTSLSVIDLIIFLSANNVLSQGWGERPTSVMCLKPL